MRAVSNRLKGHKPTYTVERDPEGNYWTVDCECGGFEEHGSTRQVVRDEHFWHRVRVVDRAATKEELTHD